MWVIILPSRHRLATANSAMGWEPLLTGCYCATIHARTASQKTEIQSLTIILIDHQASRALAFPIALTGYSYYHSHSTSREGYTMRMPTPYRRGIKAREDMKAKAVNPYKLFSCEWAWWLAGWNDRDMEGV